MSQESKWLRVIRISLNVAKTEIIIFRSEKTTITKKMNSQISSQKIKTNKISRNDYRWSSIL